MNANRLTGLLAAELVALPAGPDCCRKAEAAALVQTGIGRAGAVLTGPAAARLTVLYGPLPWSRLHAVLGLRDRAGRLRAGLPAMLIARARPCCLTAIVRGATLAAGTLHPRPDLLQLHIGFRDVPAAVAVAGAATRLHIAGRLHPDGDGERLHIPDAAGLLTRFPAPDTLTAWQQQRQAPAGRPRQTRQQANARRAATAATAAVTRLRQLVDSRPRSPPTSPRSPCCACSTRMPASPNSAPWPTRR